MFINNLIHRCSNNFTVKTILHVIFTHKEIRASNGQIDIMESILANGTGKLSVVIFIYKKKLTYCSICN